MEMIEPENFEQTTTELFEQAISQTNEEPYLLRLYIAGTTAQSVMALHNVKQICEQYLKGRYELEVIDIYQQTESIMTENIVAVPTLIKMLPPPLQRMIGNLSDTERVLIGLDIVPANSTTNSKKMTQEEKNV